MRMLEKPELTFKEQCIQSGGHICPVCGAEEMHHSGEAEGDDYIIEDVTCASCGYLIHHIFILENGGVSETHIGFGQDNCHGDVRIA
jgi:C4-type Zn-finger protein